MSHEGTSRVQRRVVFGGRVQGVGFRFRTNEIAHRYEVGGFVQNQADATVLLVVEGEPQEVDRMIDNVQSTMSGYIHTTTESPRQNATEFEQFRIRH